MKSTYRGVAIVFILLLVFLQARAQERQTEQATDQQAYTQIQLKQKYKQIDPTHYQVRPDMVMTVSFSSEGRTSLMKIMAAGSVPEHEGDARLLSRAIITSVIDELSPPATRGRRTQAITFNAGCSSIEVSYYESVTIDMGISCTGEKDKDVSSASILWKRSSGVAQKSSRNLKMPLK